MPEQLAPKPLDPVSLDAEPLKLPFQTISDAYALETVKQTFYQYEWYRQQNHDMRWNAHDAMYFGWLPPKVWEGTTTPRSNLSMSSITFGQIEAALPAILQAVFNDNKWFEIVPEMGNTPDEARQIEAHLYYNLEHGVGDKPVEIDIEHATRQLLLNGNGGVSVTFDPHLGRPVVKWVDIRDFYINPSCPTPYADDSDSIIELKRLSVADIDAMRGDERMNIPPRSVLNYMASTPSAVYGDRTKQTSEALRGVQYNPAQHEWLPLPADRKVEVLIYWSKTRIIWVFNREWVAYNKKNPYGFVPFCFAPCFPVPGRFYAQSYADKLEDMQRYTEALINAHLDELSLALHPPRVKKRGGLLTPSQQRWRPGQVQEADDPKNDVVVQWPQQATTDVMGDIAFFESSAEKLTGVNSMGQGVPRGGNVNRTATGVQSQLQGGANRLWTIVKHIEDYLIVPMLYKMYKLVQYHSQPGQILPGMGQGDQLIQVGAEAFQKPCRFRILASSKMMTKEKLQQVFPFLAQYFLNGAFLQELGSTGKTVDFDVMSRMLQDATGTGDAYPLIRQMNQQEQQARQTPPPQVAMQQQLAQMDAQTRTQIMQMKIQGDLQKTQMQKTSPQEMQMQQQQAQQDQQAEMAKLAMQLHAQRQKMALEAQKHQQDLRMKHAEHQMSMAHEQQKSQQELLLQAMMAQHQARQQQEQHQQSMQMQREQGAQQQKMTQQAGQQKLDMDRTAGQQKVDTSRKLADHKMGLEKQKMMMMKSQMARKAPQSAAKTKK